MTIKDFAKRLDGRSYGNEITKEEEALAKELGFVVVFGYSDDCAELRGAVDDEISCYDGGVLRHDELPDTILSVWCPEDVDCSWAYGTPIPHEEFHIYEGDDLYCIGIVFDINKPKMSNADRIRAMSDEELAAFLDGVQEEECKTLHEVQQDGTFKFESLRDGWLAWIQQPVEDKP